MPDSFGDLFGFEGAGDAGVVDENIHAAEIFLDFGEEAIDCGEFRDVGLDGNGAPAEFLDFGGDRFGG